MTTLHRERLALLLYCVTVIFGCRPATNRFEVAGTVTIDGQKAPQGLQVVFTPQDVSETVPMIGVTNEEGVYVMYAAPGMKGLPAGSYSVGVQTSDEQGFGPPELSRIKISARYAPRSSTLTYRVGRYVNSFDIKIESN